eukprot:1195580-Prorocentrum_minimum.AAC.4
MDSTKPFYAALEKLQYGLPDGDFNIKSQSQTWPATIEGTIVNVEMLLAQDQEKYRNDQVRTYIVTESGAE